MILLTLSMIGAVITVVWLLVTRMPQAMGAPELPAGLALPAGTATQAVTFGDGWVANLNANYRSSVYADIGDYRHRLSSRTLVNVKFGYEDLNWSAYLFAENLLDEEYVHYRNSTQPLAILGAPRVLGIGFEARW